MAKNPTSAAFIHAASMVGYDPSSNPNLMKMLRDPDVGASQLLDVLSKQNPGTALNVMRAMGETEASMYEDAAGRLGMVGVMAGSQRLIAAQRPEPARLMPTPPPRLGG